MLRCRKHTFQSSCFIAKPDGTGREVQHLHHHRLKTGKKGDIKNRAYNLSGRIQKRLTSSRGGPEGLSGITISWPASSVFDFFFGLGGVSILSSSAKLKVPTGAVTVLDASVAAGSGVGSLGGSSSSLQEQSSGSKTGRGMRKQNLTGKKQTYELTS